MDRWADVAEFACGEWDSMGWVWAGKLGFLRGVWGGGGEGAGRGVYEGVVGRCVPCKSASDHRHLLFFLISFIIMIHISRQLSPSFRFYSCLVLLLSPLLFFLFSLGCSSLNLIPKPHASKPSPSSLPLEPFLVRTLGPCPILLLLRSLHTPS